MSKSLKRVRTALMDLGIDTEIREMSDGTRTAADAACAVGCALDQIAKSIIFRGEDSGHVVLFLTAGGNQVDAEKASALAGEPLGKADAKLIRAETGFAIGGVSPVGLIQSVRAYYDPRLLAFDTVWAAAGTPRHVFPAPPSALIRAASAEEGDFVTGPA
ncbi:Cys-tRNA(Pro) deacylase, prolyl-tRNA editing enzyme YbaK/EbsC [Aliiroseovarius sediminilitoris]|uniref:Cys-tRNA(Pro) deacylase, prolyl-tRNA editing enzyme YbaK/EbsC n=1 Tax=Aliiroseovarius sediminilitoris TaxID=1173584 RepID=A0A1I0PHR3_9RHOB|nr:YbaK/EbsC family protein [Aliiroseovarius sediminilitoris]SEW13783.1 Cys-tRNA(Pro) deacylase, prolyl-tRNA editing enzyme YbaK/EbsC [Aliiroseovarius sediminilitoris]